MRGDDGASGTENLRNDVVRDRSIGQTDSRLTKETRGGRASNSRSVSAHGIFHVRNSYFRNPTEEEFRSPLCLPIEDREGIGTSADSSLS